jgi:hypothetical protein
MNCPHVCGHDNPQIYQNQRICCNICGACGYKIKWGEMNEHLRECENRDNLDGSTPAPGSNTGSRVLEFKLRNRPPGDRAKEGGPASGQGKPPLRFPRRRN